MASMVFNDDVDDLHDDDYLSNASVWPCILDLHIQSELCFNSLALSLH